jgi:hypothetical protein
MNAKSILGCPPCSDKGYKPPKGTMVAQCDECRTMVWISQKHVKIKQEKGFGVWCYPCIKKFEEECDGKNITFLPMESAGQFDDTMNDKEFTKKVEEYEQTIYTRALHSHEQAMSSLEECLPSLCRCAVGVLRIFDKLEHLAVATMIDHLIMEVLIKRRESLGPGETFSRWNERERNEIIRFLLGTGKAQRDLNIKVDEEGWDNLMQLTDQNAWDEGFNHWRDGCLYDKNSWGDEFGEEWEGGSPDWWK